MKSLSTLLRGAACATILILLSGTSHAATVTFNNVANSINRGGASAGFYSLTIDSMLLLAMCDARFSNVNPPVTWTADIVTYAGIQAGAIGKFNNPSTAATLAKYSQTGWLFSQLALMAPSNYAGHADIQEAIWKIMTPSYSLVGAGASAWYTSATSGSYDLYDWSGVMRVITANPLVQNALDVQEFLVFPNPVTDPVPVPAAVWLMGSALAGLWGLKRRQA